MGLRKEKLEDYRKLLMSHREAVAAQIRQATHDLVEAEENHADSIDQAAADTDRALALQMKSRDQGLLFQIDGALRRIDSGAFGECERCSDEISEARIKAFPFTTLCIACKAELESEGHRFLGRT